jgi:chromosome segregation ATPase
MDSLMKLWPLILLFFSHSLIAQGLPQYKSTDNSGMGRQERFDSIEKYLAEVARYSENLEKRLQEQDGSALQALRAQTDSLSKEIDKLKNENQALRREIQLIRTAVGNLSQTDFTRIQTFVQKLDGGEWDKAVQDIEGLKLTIRSLEAIIQSRP